MGYRIHLITDYKVEYGEILGSNYGVDNFISLLNRANLEFSVSDDNVFEISVDSILRLKRGINGLMFSKKDIKDLTSLIKATNFPYAKRSGIVRLECL